MAIVILLIPLALLFLGAALWALFWAIRRGQFEDLDHEAWRVVFEDRDHD
ncbi:MAG: cbb3-type cytochrome oxidase assembly protein CcoS [Alcanivorax sp.]